MSSRIFKVQVNVDDMCAELDTLRQDQHADWLAGFRAGCRGRIPDGWDGPRLMGAQFGLSCHASAEEFRQSRVAGGKARQTAHAQHMLSTCSAHAQQVQPSCSDLATSKGATHETIESDFQHNSSTCSAHAQHQTQHEGQLSNIQYPISNIQEAIKPETSEQTVADAPSSPAKKHFVQPTLEEVKAYCCSRGNDVDPNKWLSHYEAIGWKVGRNTMKDWKAAVRTWEPDGFKPKPPPPKIEYDPGYDEERLPLHLRPRSF
jgi:hypothetical protein